MGSRLNFQRGLPSGRGKAGGVAIGRRWGVASGRGGDENFWTRVSRLFVLIFVRTL